VSFTLEHVPLKITITDCLRMNIRISDTRDSKPEKIIALYKINGWSAADKSI
jgi:hypothetical protein